MSRTGLIKIAAGVGLGRRAVDVAGKVLSFPERAITGYVAGPLAGAVVKAPFKAAKSGAHTVVNFAKKHPFLAATAAAGAVSSNPLIQALSPQALVKMTAEPFAAEKMLVTTPKMQEIANNIPKSGNPFARGLDPRYAKNSPNQWRNYEPEQP